MTAAAVERPLDWRDEAVCTRVDPELFFPLDGTSFAAKRVCLGCPARVECLAWAMANPVHGIWGGTSFKERQDRARLQGRTYRVRSDAMAQREDDLAELHRLGYDDHEIATRLHLHADSVARIRKRLELAPNVVESPVPPRRSRALL